MKDGLIIDDYDASKRYYLNDKLHRVGGPAVEWANGAKYWYLDGGLHRVDGPAQEYINGATHWWLNGERHCEDGPAIAIPGVIKEWYLNGKRHRSGGPAVEKTNGLKYWFLYGNIPNLPDDFENMEEWFQYLNDNEEYSLQWIYDINGIFGFIKNPTGKQKRLNAMRWKI